MSQEVNQSPPRARRRQANLGRILDAALALVGRDGLDGLHMARLAAAVDYTPGALYRYVGSKDALVAMLVTRTVEALGRTSAAVVAELPARATPLARVFALVAGYRRFVQAEPHGAGLLAVALAEPRILVADPALAAATGRAVLAVVAPLVEALTAAMAGGHLAAGPAVERALCLATMLHGQAQLTKLARAAPAPFDVDGLARAGTRALIIGWGASPRAADSAARTFAERIAS
ncbi:MAG: helix-turn-helix domain-containing protein [Kofleriaceae bacterium]